MTHCRQKQRFWGCDEPKHVGDSRRCWSRRFGSLAVALWFWASLLKVPNNQDRFIDVLPKIGRLNAYAAFAASGAAACVAIVWLVGAYSD